VLPLLRSTAHLKRGREWHLMWALFLAVQPEQAGALACLGPALLSLAIAQATDQGLHSQ